MWYDNLMPSTVAKKRRSRIQRITDAAARVFATQGFHATRMQDIADELDLQKGTLYYYFPSKEALLFHIVEEEVGHAVEQMERVMALNATPIIKIEKGIVGHLTVFQRYADIYSIYLFEKLNLINQEAAARVDALGRKYEQYWHELLTQAVQAGELRQNLNIKLTTKAILGMCNMTLIWFKPDGPLTIEETAAQFNTLLLEGMRP